MATPIVWHLNLDAELELADPRHYAPRAELVERVRALIPRMHMLLAAEDMLLGADVPRERMALAFCPTPRALAKIQAAGLAPPPAPSIAVLARVNSRAFSAALGQTLPHACFVHDMETLQAAITAPSPQAAFVIKRPLAFAGRERRQARAGVLDVSTRGFCARTFARGEGLQVEPWLERRGDFARHGFVTRAGQLLLGPIVSQHNDASGCWLSSQPAEANALSDAEGRALAQSVSEAGEALRTAGYFGPFGVDAFRYLDADATLAFQPRSEINARFTMGYPRALLEAALAAEAWVSVGP